MSKTRIFVRIIVCLAAITLSLNLMGYSDDPSQDSDVSSPAASRGVSNEQNATRTFMIGQLGQLSVGGGDIIIGRTEDAEVNISDASRSNDYDAWARLVLAGDAYMVHDHTKCKLIGVGSGIMGFAVYHIRM